MTFPSRLGPFFSVRQLFGACFKGSYGGNGKRRRPPPIVTKGKPAGPLLIVKKREPKKPDNFLHDVLEVVNDLIFGHPTVFFALLALALIATGIAIAAVALNNQGRRRRRKRRRRRRKRQGWPWPQWAHIKEMLPEFGVPDIDFPEFGVSDFDFPYLDFPDLPDVDFSHTIVAQGRKGG